MNGTLYITGDPVADGLLNADGTALLIGMLLDQQVPMEWAFAGPATLQRRLGHLDARLIAAMDVDAFVAVCATKPAIHRFPASMGRRIHDVCTVLASEYDGRAEQIWADVATGGELYGRLRALPGYGEEKSQIFVAILGKRMGVQPEGWRIAAGKFGDDVPRSVADIDGVETLGKVREWKKAQKAAKLDKQDHPDADVIHGDAMSEGTDSRTTGSSPNLWVRAVPFLIVSVVALWLSRSFWFPSRYVVGFDTYAYSGPNIEVTKSAWRNFRLPILNDLIFGGVPHLGNPSAGALYPPQLVTLFFGTNRSMGILVALHLVLLGVGMVWLLRRLDVGRVGAAAAGVALVASGAALTKSVQFEQISVLAWTPLLLVAIHAVLNSERPWRPVAATSAVTAAVLLAGHPQLVYQTLLLAVAGTIGFTIGGDRWRRLPHLVVGAALGGLIALPQLVAVLFATADSALSLGRHQNLLDPSLSLMPSATARALLGTVQNIDPALFVGSFESVAFVGVVGAVLAVIGLTDGVLVRTTRPWTISFAVLGGLALVWAIGPRTFVFDAAFHFLPGFDLARGSARWLVVVVIIASLFVGVGVDAVMKRLRPIHLAVVGGGIVVVALALATDVVYADAHTIELWAMFVVVAAVLLGAVMLVRRSNSRVASVAAILLLAVGVAELATMSMHSIPLVLATETPFTDHPSAAVDFLAAQDQGSTIALTDDGRGTDYDVPGFRPNANVLAGVPSLDGYDGGVQITKRWATAMQRFMADPPTDLPFRNSLQLPVTPESMARLGVRYIMLDKARDPEVFIPGWVGPVAEDATVGVWENPAWIGDAIAWPTVVVDDSTEPADLLRLHADRYAGVAIVDQLDTPLPCTDPSIDGCGPVGFEVEHKTPEHLVVHTDLDGPAVLSVSRQALPGWQVTIDGERAETRLVDGLLLGVEVSAGDHVVSWTYHSPWLVPTLLVSFLALVVTLVLAAAGDRISRQGASRRANSPAVGPLTRDSGASAVGGEERTEAGGEGVGGEVLRPELSDG